MQDKKDKYRGLYDVCIWFLVVYGVASGQCALHKLGEQQSKIDAQQSQIEVLQKKLQEYNTAKTIQYNDSINQKVR